MHSHEQTWFRYGLFCPMMNLRQRTYFACGQAEQSSNCFARLPIALFSSSTVRVQFLHRKSRLYESSEKLQITPTSFSTLKTCLLFSIPIVNFADDVQP